MGQSELATVACEHSEEGTAALLKAVWWDLRLASLLTHLFLFCVNFVLPFDCVMLGRSKAKIFSVNRRSILSKVRGTYYLLMSMQNNNCTKREVYLPLMFRSKHLSSDCIPTGSIVIGQSRHWLPAAFVSIGLFCCPLLAKTPPRFLPVFNLLRGRF